ADAGEPLFPPRELTGLFPPDHRMTYDAEEVLARLVDRSLFWEVMPDRGREMIVGVGRVAGLYVGFVANRQGLIDDPSERGGKKPAGILYREGIAKVAAFSRACNDDGIPLVWLQDISGFDIGVEAERQGLLGYGSSLIYTNSTNQTPMFSVLLRKASGAGYYAMAGLPYEPVVQLSTPLTRQSVMEGRTLAIAAYNTKLDDDFEILETDPEKRAEIERGMAETEERIEGDMDPYKSASQMDTDEIVDLDELRSWLELFAEASYQASGTRRVKNPRIWSLHDVEALTGAGGAARRMELRVARTDDGRIELRAPDVGELTGALERGALLGPGMVCGTLLRLGRAIDLVVPEGAAGLVVSEPPRALRAPTGYDEVVYVLDPSGAGSAGAAHEDEVAGTDGSALAVKASQPGRVWLSPSPGDPPLAPAGADLEEGAALCLIEVMKTFSTVPYAAGGGLPARARVARWLVEDGADVEPGTPLVEIEPL
ncbi:MAG: carboxyl transferase domain-containing protein, partial [Planctomycetota bacterium]